MLLVYSRALIKHCKRATTVFSFRKLILNRTGKKIPFLFKSPKTQGKQEPSTNSLFMSRVRVNVNPKLRCK